MLDVGQKAPDFSLMDQEGTSHKLGQYLGSWIVLYFYPKDDTPGCTKEACGFRDVFEELKKNDITILGVSKDSVVSHRKFNSKYHLNFTLLSDEDKIVIKQFGAWGKKKFLGREYDGVLRITYLIDPKGKIKKIYENVKPEEHANEILHDVATFAE